LPLKLYEISHVSHTYENTGLIIHLKRKNYLVYIFRFCNFLFWILGYQDLMPMLLIKSNKKSILANKKHTKSVSTQYDWFIQLFSWWYFSSSYITLLLFSALSRQYSANNPCILYSCIYITSTKKLIKVGFLIPHHFQLVLSFNIFLSLSNDTDLSSVWRWHAGARRCPPWITTWKIYTNMERFCSLPNQFSKIKWY